MNNNVRIGIDIGGTNSVIGIVTPQGEIIFETSLPTTRFETAQAFVDEAFTVLQPQIEQLGLLNFKGMGIGAPNGNYYNGTIEFAPNLRWKGIIPLARMFSEKFNLPATLSNDANAAAMGEMIYGAAQGMNDFIMVTLGTGVGSGFVANGKLLYGHDGFAGELGHVIVVPQGRDCGCGRKGCLETYTSATGIVRTAHEFLAKQTTDSVLRQVSNITAKAIYEAAVSGDALALAIFNYTGTILGTCLANAVAITSPEAIILFGGLAQAGDFIVKPTQQAMEENLLSIYKNKVKLLPSQLPESRAAILGAAALAS